MSHFSKEKFQSLKLERQVRLLLEQIYKTEKLWQERLPDESTFSALRNYFQWCDFYHSESISLKKMAHLDQGIGSQMSMRQLLDLAVPLERFLSLSIKDDQIFEIQKEDRLDRIQQKKKFPVRLVLDHLRSAFNVGSIFRSAECLGIEHIELVGYTPTPMDDGVKKTAMGCEKWVSWSQNNHMESVVGDLRSDGYQLLGLETTEQSVPLHQVSLDSKVAVFVGNERFGLSESLLLQLDACVAISMYGVKNSLNVANAVSIASYSLVERIVERD